VVDDARTDSGGSAFRGFLFSDVRGFTAFAERHGNTEAAAMVGRFLELARRAITSHEGAEIKTEGDAIHAVFPSASSAVLCGLEIVDAAAELNAREPDRPLGLGVGVHAGEAVETAEGYIGTAVNVAARLCAVAQPGEVLVSSTVKGMTQASIPVGYMARGRRRLKGIREPVEVFAATHDLTARTARAMPSAVVGSMAGLGALVLLAIAVTVGSQVVGTPGASLGASAIPTTQPVAIGSLDVGTYASAQFQPPLTFHIVEPGWAASRDTPDLLGLIRESDPPGSVFFLRITKVLTSGCDAGDPEAGTGLGTADVLADMEDVTFLDVSEPMPVEIGGIPAKQVDVAVSNAALAACGGLAGADVTVFDVGGEIWRAASGERFRLVSVDVGGQAVTIITSTEWDQIPSVQQLEDMFEVGQRLLDTVEF
jgi:class 3 adenylate cyclase